MHYQRGSSRFWLLLATTLGAAVACGSVYYSLQNQLATRAGSEYPANTSQTAPASILFTASLDSGVAPLAVHFVSNKYATQDASESQHYVDFGDGTERGRITCAKFTGTDLGNRHCEEWGVDHTYTLGGTYVAKLIEVAPCTGTTCPAVRQETVLKTLPITVSR